MEFMPYIPYIVYMACITYGPNTIDMANVGFYQKRRVYESILPNEVRVYVFILPNQVGVYGFILPSHSGVNRVFELQVKSKNHQLSDKINTTCGQALPCAACLYQKQMQEQRLLNTIYNHCSTLQNFQWHSPKGSVITNAVP